MVLRKRLAYIRYAFEAFSEVFAAFFSKYKALSMATLFILNIVIEVIIMFESWKELEKSIIGCERCKLCKGRKNIVFGTGNTHAKMMFIGEGPGGDEDIQGKPFVGKAGKLMDKAFIGLDIKREDVYIANVIKCRPPQNRDPEKDEILACINYLRNQVILVKPKIIILLGKIALNNILGEEYKLTRDRGKWVDKNGILYMPTWHPAALLRDETKKIEFWKDLKEANKKCYELE